MSKEYIERGALLVLLEERRDFLFKENGDYDHYSNGLDEAVDKVENFPVSADVVEVKHGEWEFGELDVLGAPVKCSRCGFGVDRADPILWLDYDGHKFCGNCGAKMDGGAGNG